MGTRRTVLTRLIQQEAVELTITPAHNRRVSRDPSVSPNLFRRWRTHDDSTANCFVVRGCSSESRHICVVNWVGERNRFLKARRAYFAKTHRLKYHLHR